MGIRRKNASSYPQNNLKVGIREKNPTSIPILPPKRKYPRIKVKNKMPQRHNTRLVIGIRHTKTEVLHGRCPEGHLFFEKECVKNGIGECMKNDIRRVCHERMS